jgi:protein-serine/threonine kinase
MDLLTLRQYAMLAGYLPFDDDPANPEGDNINLLYKYIVNTPLTFPEYVTPHARDLLRRILVPDPRKRADLFEVARHSWLSEYAHVVELITSSTTTPSEIQNTSLNADEEGDNHVPHRSNSVREANKKATASPTVGGLTSKQGGIDQDEAAYVKAQKDAKRRTVQVEYVAPRTQTQRGEPSGSQPAAGKTRARSGSQGPVEVSSSNDKPLPRDPPVAKPTAASRRPSSAHKNAAGPTRPNRDGARAISDNPYMTSVAGASGARPPTGGSMQSTRSARGSYSQPLPPEVADTNAHGRIQQPSRGSDKNFGMPNPSQEQNMDYGRPSISAVPTKFARVSGFAGEGGQERADGREGPKGHRRSNTIGEISGKLFGRSGSLFGGRKGKRADNQQQAQEKQKRYPPVSMNYSMPGGEAEAGRPSIDSKRSSRRSFSQALGRKRSGSVSGSQTSHERQNRRFSFIPSGFSLKAIGIGKDESLPVDSLQDLPIQEPPPRVDQYGRYVDRPAGNTSTVEGMYAQLQDPVDPEARYNQQQQQQQRQEYGGRPPVVYNTQGAVLNTESESSIDNNNNIRRPPGSAPHQQQQYMDQQQQAYDQRRIASTGRHPGKGAVLQKNKRFVDAWDTDESGRAHDHSGSSGPARKVMDFFRRRGKARGGE